MNEFRDLFPYEIERILAITKKDLEEEHKEAEKLKQEAERLRRLGK